MDTALFSNGIFLVAQNDGPLGGWFSIVTIWLPILVIFWFLLIRPQQREQAKRRDMLGGLKKNDRVITAGGVYGVVTNIHREADEVTLKVDEATNTKIRVTFGSITRVLGSDSSEPSSSS